MRDTVTILGSHGSILVHAASGHIVGRELDGPEYNDIIWFDPTYLREDEMDILEAAPVYTDGSYASPMQSVEVGEDPRRGPYYEWRELPRLAAPSIIN